MRNQGRQAQAIYYPLALQQQSIVTELPQAARLQQHPKGASGLPPHGGLLITLKCHSIPFSLLFLLPVLVLFSILGWSLILHFLMTLNEWGMTPDTKSCKELELFWRNSIIGLWRNVPDSPSMHKIPDDRNLQFVFFSFLSFYSQLIYFNFFFILRWNIGVWATTNCNTSRTWYSLRWASSKDCKSPFNKKK